MSSETYSRNIRSSTMKNRLGLMKHLMRQTFGLLFTSTMIPRALPWAWGLATNHAELA